MYASGVWDGGRGETETKVKRLAERAVQVKRVRQRAAGGEIVTRRVVWGDQDGSSQMTNQSRLEGERGGGQGKKERKQRKFRRREPFGLSTAHAWPVVDDRTTGTTPSRDFEGG